METAAVIIVVGAAALAAALGFAAGLAARRWANFALPAYWFALAGAAAGGLVGTGVVGGWADAMFPAERIAVEKVLPYMDAIKTSDEALYERIETSILRDQADGKSPELVRANAKALVSSYVADKIPGLSDELTYELYATTRDILAHLDASNEVQTCADVALGRYKGDIDPLLSPDLVQRNDSTIVRVITAKFDPDAVKMPAEQFAELASNGFAQATQFAGISPEEVEKLLGGEGDPAKTCKLMKGFIDAVLSHPAEVAASALRRLAAGGRV
jgi:hypothetical protein